MIQIFGSSHLRSCQRQYRLMWTRQAHCLIWKLSPCELWWALLDYTPLLTKTQYVSRALFLYFCFILATRISIYFYIVDFKADLGNSCVSDLTLLNAGNIPLQLTLEVSLWPDFFTVTPTEMYIEPQKKENVQIKFHPTHTKSKTFERLV